MISLQPRGALRSRVASIDVVENRDGGVVTVLPTAGAVLGLQSCGRVQAGEKLLSVAGVTGIQDSVRHYAHIGETHSLLVRFTPQGAACLGVPALELSGQSLALDALIAPARVREAHERLLDAASVRERVAVVEELLLGLPFVEDRLIEHAAALLSGGSCDAASVAAVARELALSERQLERRFLSRIGISPKRFVMLRRFERAVELIQRSASLTHAALDAGYYDQSHFIREFRRFAGAAPGRFLRQLPRT